MKNIFLFAGLLCLLTATAHAQSGIITQTFEPGEDTSDWGSTWNGSGAITSGFLSSSLGGQNAGIGASSGQNFSRSFVNNTAGISITNPYYVSMYVQVNTETNNTPNSGELDIIDGSGGTGSPAVDIQVRANGSGQLIWTAYNNGSYDSFGINLNLMSPYYISYSLDPSLGTYSATVSEVDTDGNIIPGQSATLDGLVGDHNSFVNSNGHGTLGFYLQTSAGNASALVDNITISSSPISTTPTPEPSTMALAAGGLATIFLLKRSRRTA